LSILSNLLRLKRSDARDLNTRLWPDRQAQRAEKSRFAASRGGELDFASRAMSGHFVCEGTGHAVEDFTPLAHYGLAEEPQAGIPGGMVAVDHPAPVSRTAEGHPALDAECAGQVSDSGLGRDDQVEKAHDGGGVEEVAAWFEAGDVMIDIGDRKLPTE